MRDQKRLSNRQDVRLSTRGFLQLFLVKVFVMETHNSEWIVIGLSPYALYIINNYSLIYINIFLSEETEDTEAKL